MSKDEVWGSFILFSYGRLTTLFLKTSINHSLFISDGGPMMSTACITECSFSLLLVDCTVLIWFQVLTELVSSQGSFQTCLRIQHTICVYRVFVHLNEFP